jgi:PiT family inorganic phosphate transporter
MAVFLLLAAALLLAFANGANDNFKGFATVWGARTLSFRAASLWAAIATAAGSVASVVLAQGLIRQFSGKGLVSDTIVADPNFLAAVAVGAAVTVSGATRLALPISTTHALVGGLLGAGLAAGSVNAGALAALFVAPLLLSPFASAALAFAAQAVMGPRLRQTDCLCLIEGARASAGGGPLALARATAVSAVVARAETCERIVQPHLRFSVGAILDRVHIASAAIVCFARSVNDTPKLAALLFAAQGLGGAGPSILTGVAMVSGGLFFSRRVAETMSLKLNRLDPSQGLLANLVTSALVLSASTFALPVSTTHVAVGAITGAGVRAGTLDWSAVRQVLLSWVATLPAAALCAWLAFRSLAG